MLLGDTLNIFLLTFLKAWLSSSADIYCTYRRSKFMFFFFARWDECCRAGIIVITIGCYAAALL
jgi:hypothetical protein